MVAIIKNAQKILQNAEKHIHDRISLPFGIDASVKQVILTLGVTGTITYAVSNYIVYRLYLHPLAKIPGPPVDWIPFLGNMRTIIREEAGVPHKKWTKKYGGMVLYHGPWNIPRLLISDTDVLKDVLMAQHYDFTKTPEGARLLGRILGHGLLVSEGEVHRRQRKMLNPAFSLQAIRDLTPILFVPPVQLCEKWMDEVKTKQTTDDEAVEIIVSHGLSLATLDEIGLAGFGQEFNAVRYDGTDKVSKLGWAYQTIFDPKGPSITGMLGLFIPMLRNLPTQRNRELKTALKVLDRESREVVQRGIERAGIKSEASENHLLALMIRLSNDESGQGFTAEELRNQCLTFLAAGHETTAVSLSWSLWLLAQHQDIQDALRAEVTPLFDKVNMEHQVFHDDPFEVGFDGANIPSFEAINKLHLLENICRETSRLIPVVPLTSRVTAKDVILKGQVIPKNTYIALSPIVNHHNKELWGEDAEEFRPGRWDEEAAAKAGPYDYLPFLAGGRQCIGYRFALIELKIILAILITKFHFFEKPEFVLKKRQMLTLRPSPNMTLLVKPARSP
ncbi:cytochrome P450 [Fennellomyces sp. T-0311]|nr:cytochrome P450 [Fennellomyces sp. T-0311]